MYIWKKTDINECLALNGNCSQICINTPGSATCSCMTGYVLNPDLMTCTGKKTFIIIMNHNERKMNLFIFQTLTNVLAIWETVPSCVTILTEAITAIVGLVIA